MEAAFPCLQGVASEEGFFFAPEAAGRIFVEALAVRGKDMHTGEVDRDGGFFVLDDSPHRSQSSEC